MGWRDGLAVKGQALNQKYKEKKKDSNIMQQGMSV